MTAIDVRALGFSYAGAPRPAVRAVSFSVGTREISGF
jgi:hypothetical protein